jgi:predicted RNase H-like nuclease (RuvC/YqgF family)
VACGAYLHVLYVARPEGGDMSDAEYRVNDLERTVEELRFQVRWLKTQNETLESQLERCREDGDKARIEATRWKMLYEQARDE